MYFRLSVFLFALMLVAACGSSSGDDSTPDVVDLELAANSIELDPYGVAPLSARLRFEPPEPGTLTIRVEGKGLDGLDIAHAHEGELEGAIDHPVLGLYENHINEIYIEFVGVSGQVYTDVISIATQSLPWGFGAVPDIEIVTNNLTEINSMVYMFSRQRFAFDSGGEIRWSYLGNSQDLFRKLPNGNLLASITEAPIGYHVPKFAEVSMLGEISSEYMVDNYLHHEVRKLPWGNYLVGGNSSLIDFDPNGVPEEDVLLEVSSLTGAVVKVWDFNTILDPMRAPIPSNGRADDWLHLNSAVYDSTDDSIYITSQRQSLVAKIDYETGALLWILGAHELWGANLQGKLLTPVNEAGEPIDIRDIDFWPYGPHAVLPLQDGRVALYDNGSYRGWYSDNSVPSDSYSRAVEYLVDEADMTVHLQWEYTAGKQIFTPATGDIDMVDQADGFLIGFAGRSADSATPRIMEVDRSGGIIFEAVSQAGSQDYRVEKFDLYDGL